MSGWEWWDWLALAAAAVFWLLLGSLMVVASCARFDSDRLSPTKAKDSRPWFVGLKVTGAIAWPIVFFVALGVVIATAVADFARWLSPESKEET